MVKKNFLAEMILFGIFVVTFFTFLGKVAETLTGLYSALDWWIALAGGTLWGTYFYARLSSHRKEG